MGALERGGADEIAGGEDVDEAAEAALDRAAMESGTD
jgi:hypothetical protein